MAFALKRILRLHQIKQQVNLITSSNHNLISQSSYGKLEPLSTLTRSFQQYREPLTKLNITAKLPVMKSCSTSSSNVSRSNYFSSLGGFLSQNKWSVCGVLAFIALEGSILFMQPCIVDGIGGRVFFIRNPRGLFDSSEVEETPPDDYWVFVRRFWLPAFCSFTILTTWIHPFFLVTNAVLLLLITKPTPLSVYAYIEQFYQEQMPESDCDKKIFYFNKIEVQDYKLLCLARVKLGNDKFLTIVGMFGSWWFFPDIPIMFKNKNYAPTVIKVGNSTMIWNSSAQLR
ncbi:hypothetical protein ACFE04_010434 [Oxalis oulophora]